MSIDESGLSDDTLKMAVRIAQQRHCTVDELIRTFLQPIDKPTKPAGRLIGLMSDEPELMDEVMKSVYEARENHPLRQPANGQSSA